jgi:hypothetical protein
MGIGGDNLLIEELRIVELGPSAVEGTKLATCSVRPADPGRPMHMNVDTAPSITFKEGIVAREAVLDVRSATHRHIKDQVPPPLAAFVG